MNLFNAALRSIFGASAIVLILSFAGQAQTHTLKNKTLQSKKPLASALGGPVTPSNPNLFLGSNTSVLQPPTLENATAEDGSPLKAPPLRYGPAKPITPFVDDPPRPSAGGLFSIKTD
jgi:hypothetical protein